MTKYQPNKPPVEGSPTPWGYAQSVTQIMKGIYVVKTASHGGAWVSRTAQRVLPGYMRTPDQWYEEDGEMTVMFDRLKHLEVYQETHEDAWAKVFMRRPWNSVELYMPEYEQQEEKLKAPEVVWVPVLGMGG